MSYTVNELCIMNNCLSESESINDFMDSLNINDYKFIHLLKDLFDSKIIKETKLRKKRVIKLIELYKRKEDYINNTKGIKDFLKSDDINNIIKSQYGSKKMPIDDETVIFYIKDFNEFFNMFAPNTLLSDILQTCK